MNITDLNINEIINIIGSVVLISRIVVKITPTPVDDNFLSKILTLLKHLGLHISETSASQETIDKNKQT